MKPGLSEGIIGPDVKTREIILDYRVKTGKSFVRHSIGVDGKVFVPRSITIDAGMVDNGKLKLQFSDIYGEVSVLASLTSFEGFPRNINPFLSTSKTDQKNRYPRSLSFVVEQKITSFDHCTEMFGSSIDLSMCKSLRFSRVHEHIKELRGGIGITGQYVGPLLSLLLIKGMKKLGSATGMTHGPIFGTWPDRNARTHEAATIINDHINGDKDIMECQEELIQHGLNEYAKL